MQIEDRTAAAMRCPACGGGIEIKPVDDESGWTGDIKVKHASPSCDWVKVEANVTAWLHTVLLHAVEDPPS